MVVRTFYLAARRTVAAQCNAVRRGVPKRRKLGLQPPTAVHRPNRRALGRLACVDAAAAPHVDDAAGGQGLRATGTQQLSRLV